MTPPSTIIRKKRFLILTSDSGFGHRSAANAVAKALALQHPQGAVTSVVNPLLAEDSSLFLKKTELHYDRTVKNNPTWYRFAFGISDSRSASMFVESTLVVAMFKNMRLLIQELNPDVILSTNQMFNAPAGIVRGLMRRKPAFFTVVTDLADVHAMWFNSSPDRFFVASEDVRMKAVANGISPNKVTISGIPVDPEFNSSQTSKQERRFHLGLNPQLTTLLFVGSRRVSGVFDHIKALEGILHPFQVVVIAGGDEDLYQQCVQHTWRFPIHIENYVKNMPEWMLSADLLVTKAGGLILSEGLAAGLPIILIDYLPGQEEGNVRFIIEHQAGEIIQCTGNFLQLVNSWLWDNQTLLKNFAKNARMLGHPDSAFVVANALWEAADPYLA